MNGKLEIFLIILKSRPKWFHSGIPLNMMGDMYDAEIFFEEYNPRIRIIGKKQ